MLRIKKTLVAIGCVAFGIASAPAIAIPIAESGDAGDSLATAQLVPGNTDSISGSLADGNDADLFGFAWGGGILSLEVTAADFDSQLFLFDAFGVIVGANDDGGAGLLSLLTGGLASGTYFLGITSFNSDPLNAGGTDIEDPLGGGSVTAYQPGVCGLALADCVLASWRDGGGFGDYRISFTAVPEPATLAILVLGLFGMGLARRRVKI